VILPKERDPRFVTVRLWAVFDGRAVARVDDVERAVGIGGFFFRAADPEALAAWYEANLGIASFASGGSWEQQAGPTVFAPFPADTDYFGRADQQTMLNFRVTNLDAMLRQLRAGGAQVDDEVAEADFGRFGHAVDPEGNRFELWEVWDDAGPGPAEP
jgi:predicted enzyme related to lactoylglutathione lyase